VNARVAVGACALAIAVSSLMMAASPRLTVSASDLCGTGGCSGSDGSWGTNFQGNAPQVYIGEIGSFATDFFGNPGPCPADEAGMCFNTGGASGADSRQAGGTGVGVVGYYFGGGARYASQVGLSDFCWGWAQGASAINDVFANGDYFGQYYSIDIQFFDVEGVYWASSTDVANRQVFNGFYDYVHNLGMESGQSCSQSEIGYAWQPAIYSSPDEWSSYLASAGNIAGTPEWTTQYCCTDSYPGGMGNAQPFGGSDYLWLWQYYENLSTDVDYDIMEAPQYVPALGIYWG